MVAIDVNSGNFRREDNAEETAYQLNIAAAKEIARQLIRDGKVFKAYIGLMLQEVNLNPKIRSHYNLANKKGLFVTKIEADSPASRSQLQEGDLIISFNGKTVNSSHELFKELTSREILKMVDISVIRHTELLNFSIAATERKVKA